MPEFILDSDGEVAVACRPEPVAYADLDQFTQGYIEAMFFTETSGISMVDWHSEASREAVREGQADGDIPGDAGFSDLHPDSLAEIMADCADFQAKGQDMLQRAYATGNYEAMQAGRDFWFSRNGHGAGFFDREIGEVRDELQSLASDKFGQVDPWFSDSEESVSPTGYGFVYHSM